MNDPVWFGIAVITLAAIIAAVPVIRKFRHVFCVPEGWTGLLYHHGLYVRRNNAGRHVIWGHGWTINLVDLRKTSLIAPGEDFIMADNLYLRVSPHISYQITDPIKAAHETQHWPNELCNIALRAVHNLLRGFSCPDLLHERPGIGAQLLAQTQPEACKIGIHILAIDLRYWIFPADCNRALTVAPGGGSTLVLGVPGGFVPLKQQTKNVAPEGHEAK